MGGDSGGGGGGQTVTSQTAIPDWQQGAVQANENLATSLAAQPYPTYSGQLIAGFSPQQQQGMDMAQTASTAQQPDLTAAEGLTQQSTGAASPYFQAAGNMAQASNAAASPYFQAAGNMAANASQPWSAAAAQQYMSPYAMAAMAPQLQQLQIQQGQQANQIGARATQAGAFGDAQYGAGQALNNFYGNLAQNDLVSQGMNTAYNSALGAFNTGNQNQISAANAVGNTGQNIANAGNAAAGTLNTTGQNMGNSYLNAAQGLSSLGQAQQSTGIAGANAEFNAGTQQQQLNQQQLTEAYQNFMNQAMWPEQGLNMRIASTANNQYQIPTATLAPTSASGANLGAFASAAGGLGSLLGGGSSGSSSLLAGYSDRRLKKNIKKIGKLISGLPVYSFNYLWSDQPIVGVMADEAIEKFPEAISYDRDGYAIVDYAMVH